MVKTMSFKKMVILISHLSLASVLLFGLNACESAEKKAASTMSSENNLAGGNEYGTCVVSISEKTQDPKNTLFRSMNKKMKCSQFERCYHIVVEGTCDSTETPVVLVEATELNADNFSDKPEKNGSYKYSKNTICIDGSFKQSVWLQLKGTDNLEIKTKHFKSLASFKADPTDYVLQNTSAYGPDFDAGVGEVKGFKDVSSTYHSKLKKCRLKFPGTYTKDS